MIGSISPGQIINWYSNRKSSPHTFYHSKGVIASDTNLIPFSFDFQDASGGITEWTLIPIGNGATVQMNTNDLVTHVGNGRRWVSFFGGTLSSEVPCGVYEMKIVFGSSTFYSDPIQVKGVSFGYVRAGLMIDTGAFGTSQLVTPNDIITGAIVTQTFQSSTDNATWLNVTGTFDLTIPTGNVWFRRTITTESDASSVLYRWDGTNLVELSDQVPANGFYYLDISSTQPHNDILYHKGFVKRLYFEGSVTPIFDDEPELIENGDGETFLTYAKVSDSLVLTALNIPDGALGGLYEGKHHTATVGRIGGSSMTTQGFEIAVQPVGNTNNVQLTFQRAIYITRACEQDLIVTP